MKDVPEGRKLVGCKWVYKLKRNGVYRSRLVALGYTQIPGVDFTDKFSPVVHDVTLRTALILWIVLGLDVDQIDVEEQRRLSCRYPEYPRPRFRYACTE